MLYQDVGKSINSALILITAMPFTSTIVDRMTIAALLGNLAEGQL